MKRSVRGLCSWRRAQTYLKIVGVSIVCVIVLNMIFGYNNYKMQSQRFSLGLAAISDWTYISTRSSISAIPYPTDMSSRYRPNASLKESGQRESYNMSSRYRESDAEKTGNPLIDDYPLPHPQFAGERGQGVVLTVDVKAKVEELMKKYRVNILASDEIPLNRLVPDSRIQGCSQLQYDVPSLPDASVIVPFYNEWPSVLYRTIYSIINRTPRRLLREIILVDDNSQSADLHQPLDDYIARSFPPNLVKIVRQPSRLGLIQARMAGVGVARGEVLVFFDSHMEVNIDWLPPLLTEISRNKSVVAMATLDYIQPDTFEYRYNQNYLTRYAWDWRMVFFETHFRPEQSRPITTKPRPGVAMVGAAYAIDKAFFLHLGGYDEGMTVWGGENLEMSWRVWLCGGQLLHVPCSRIGHIARPQPYSFPGGREQIENYNYKRAAEVWMGDYSKFLYFIRPKLKTLDVGDLSSRLELKKTLQCRDFSWYLKNVWPEINAYDRGALHWGNVKNTKSQFCLDNNAYLFPMLDDLYLKPCQSGDLHSQGFTLTSDQRLRTTLQCVVVPSARIEALVRLEDCLIGHQDTWEYNADQHLVHLPSGLCLDVQLGRPVVKICHTSSDTQRWTFNPFPL